MHNVMQQDIMNQFLGKSGKNNKGIHIKIATKKQENSGKGLSGKITGIERW
jgi:hypothetical protein